MYPLYKLSQKDFKVLINTLHELTHIEEIDLTNCGLNYLKSAQLGELLVSVNNLVLIKLDNNNLSTSDKKLNQVYQALKTLPRLHFFSIHDKGQQKQTVPIHLLTSLPALRVLKKNEENTTISFLNRTEINVLLNFLKNNPSVAHDYFNISAFPYEFDNATTDGFNIIKDIIPLVELYSHRLASKANPCSFPPQTLMALQFLDTLHSTGIKMHYCTTQKIYILVLEARDATSCERVAHRLLNHLPMDLNWQLKLPNTLSHFSLEAISELGEKYPGNLQIIRTDNGSAKASENFDKKNPDYIALKSWSRSFSLYDTHFYDVLNNKEKLSELTELLKRILNSDNNELKKIMGEFFTTYLLPITGELLEEDMLSLLRSDNKTVSQLLHSPCKALDTSPQNDSQKASAQRALQAKAWWGRIAFYEINQNSEEGLYWYGRFLHEFPSEHSDQAQPSERGLYWIRLTATHYKNPKARNYLSQLIRTEKELCPADRYQLILASEELEIPSQNGKLFKPRENFSTLFPNRNFRGLLSSFNYIFASEDRFSEQHKQYLHYLIHDNLIPARAKVHLITHLTNTLYTNSSSLIEKLSKTQAELTRYHTAPLGMEIKSRIIPLLSQPAQHNQNAKLDNTKPMSLQPEYLRSGVFCQFFKEHLNAYIKHCKLFGTEIASHENPSYVAALVHELLTQSIKYFELNDTKLAEELDQKMQSIKNDLQEYFFRRELATQTTSLEFREAMTKRLVSYSTTAYVANTTELSLLRRFGEAHGGEKNSAHKPSIAKKILYGAAFAIETLHISVPIIVAATGVGIPVASTSSVFIKGLQFALKKIHHYAESAEHLMETYKGATNLVVGLAHAHHLAHEAGFISHGHHAAPTRLTDFDTIKHLNDLLLNAAVSDIDNIATLIKHWAAVYQPITDELTETSNTILGILLIELLLRGLTLRLYAEKHVISGKKTEMPNSISGLLNYFNETLN